MKITDVTTWVVNIPLRSSFTSSFETKAGVTRTVIRLRTDDGHEGWGETMHGSPVARLIERLAPDLTDRNPHNLADLHRQLEMVPFFYGYHGYAAIAGLDIACWDLIGKAAEQPLVNLIGGRVREEVPITALVTRADAGEAGVKDLPRAIAEHAADVVAARSFTAVKLKGTRDPDGDAEIMAALRNKLGSVNLRVDPNAAWTVPESVRVGRRMEPLELEYLEDPCGGLEGMCQVRKQVAIPLCTNMCVVRFEDFAPGVRLEAVDVVHGDVYKWGGVMATKQLAGHCRTFGLGMNMHSGGECGVATAAHLAVVASSPEIEYAIDSMYYLLADDIITQPYTVQRGALPVPEGPGLGIEVDMDKLAHYARRNEIEGDHDI